MSFDTLMVASKIISLFLYVPIFLGVLFWAYRRKNKETLESYASMPLQED
ncbi:MAG TPA: cbb3-type cytochrome c oxidase subunit 3 [Stenomitos sp.]